MLHAAPDRHRQHQPDDGAAIPRRELDETVDHCGCARAGGTPQDGLRIFAGRTRNRNSKWSRPSPGGVLWLGRPSYRKPDRSPRRRTSAPPQAGLFMRLSESSRKAPAVTTRSPSQSAADLYAVALLPAGFHLAQFVLTVAQERRRRASLFPNRLLRRRVR